MGITTVHRTYHLYCLSFFLWKSWEQQKLEKLQDDEQVEKPFIRKQMKIRFPERGRSGQSVVAIKNLEFGFEDKVTNMFNQLAGKS